MLPVERWTIFYADGSTFASDDGSWAEAPPFGVQAVVYYRVDGSTLFQQEGRDDSIFWFEGNPEGCERSVKMGLWTDGASYWRVHDLARRAVSP
jgi:hypothetical protein